MASNKYEPEVKFIRVKDAMRIASLSRTSLDRAFADGELRKYKRGRAVLINAQEFQTWIESGLVT